MSRRRTAPLAIALSSVLAVSACGAGKALAGVHEPPAEVTTTAPLSSGSALEIATRVLTQATEASRASGREAAALREQSLTGAALAVANADSRLPGPAAETSSPMTKPTAPKVLAISRGGSWPRFILVQTTREDGAAVLNLLTSPDVKTPFRLASTAPMQPGSSVAALNTLEEGSPVLASGKGPAGKGTGGHDLAGKGLAAEPSTVLEEYAKSMAYPKPAEAEKVNASDPVSASMRANAAAQAKRLGKLATLTQKHTVLPTNTVTIALRDGGAIVFGLLERIDTITLESRGKSLTPGPDVQRLLRKKTLTDRAELRTYETVVLTVPPSGRSAVVGVDEVLVSAKGE